MVKQGKRSYVRLSGEKEKKGMMFLKNNPLIVSIIGTVIGGMLVGLVLLYLSERRAEKTAKTALIARTNDADKLLKKNLADDALAIYEDILNAFPVRKYPKIYARIKNNEGICYRNLAYVSGREKNLTKAIKACQEALKIYTLEEYPLDYETIISNMRKAKQKMKGEK